MKVIYDISVLAQARRDARARTGVFRVVDSVARGLAASGECSLSFCVAEGVNEPIDFLADDPQLSGVGLSLSRSTQFRLQLYNRIYGLTDRIRVIGPGVGSTSLKMLRKTLYHVADLSHRYGRVMREEDLAAADIYHSPFSPIPKQAAEARDLKRFVTIYDLIPIMFPDFFEPAMTGLMTEVLTSLGSQDFALCISQSTKNDLCNHRPDLDPSRVFVTRLAASKLFYPCMDADRRTAVRRKYKIPEGVPYLLSLSTLEPRKNIAQVVKCFSRLIQEQSIDDLRLVLVGTKGWNYDRILETVASSSISRDYIILTGYVADEDLAVLYSDALAFLFLSLYEGFGLPPLEAMQCGTPVITSNTSSLPEIVGDAGIMLDPMDTEGVCQSMLEIYRNQTSRAAMSQKSLERARQFSWEKCTDETVLAYRQALG